MTIKPFDLRDDPDIPLEFQALLEDSGAAPKIEPIKKGKQNIDSAREIFNARGAGIKEAADAISGILSNGGTDNGKLRASELILRVHGILNEMDEKTVPNIVINVGGIVGQSGTMENKVLVNLVCPNP